MITSTQKRELKRLFHEMNPDAERDDYFFDELDRFEDRLATLKDTFGKELQSISDRIEKQLTDKMDAIMSQFDAKLVSKSQDLTTGMSKLKGDIIRMFPDVDKIVDGKLPSVTKQIEKHKDDFNQLIEEVRGDIKIVYSKLGGATMPRPFSMEIPSGTVDGSNMVFTTRNRPSFMDVSGAIMVSNVDDPNNYGYTITGSAPKFTITFLAAPGQGESNPSSQVPHSYFNP